VALNELGIFEIVTEMDQKIQEVIENTSKYNENTEGL
jgi:hypothetical protein